MAYDAHMQRFIIATSDAESVLALAAAAGATDSRQPIR